MSSEIQNNKRYKLFIDEEDEGSKQTEEVSRVNPGLISKNKDEDPVSFNLELTTMNKDSKAQRNLSLFTQSKILKGKKEIKLDEEKPLEKDLDQNEELNILVKEGEKKIAEAVKMRKKMRFFAYFLYLAIIGISLLCVISTRTIENKLMLPPNANLDFNIDNCTLLITDHTDSAVKSPAYIKYRIPQGLIHKVTKVTTNNTDSKSSKLEFLNGLDTRHCLIHLFLQEGVPLQSLSINCTRCNITQDTSFQLQVDGSVTITGTNVHANFRNIKVGSLRYESTVGYLQLNHIETKPGKNVIKMNEEGDIIIQSTKNFRLEATSYTQAFCFSAPALNEVDISKCAISGNNSTSSFKDNPDCHLTYDICTEKDCTTPLVHYVVKSKMGNVYANLISSVGYPVYSPNMKSSKEIIYDDGLNLNPKGDLETDSFIPLTHQTTTPRLLEIIKGQVYDNGIKFNKKAEETIRFLDDLMLDETKGNPFILLNVGDFASRSSRSSKWAISSLPSFALMRPYWIGTFSASILSVHVKKDNGFLLPGFCPFVPEFTTENLFQIQELINSNVEVPTALTTLISDPYLPLPPVSPRPSSGIAPSIKQGDPFDYWFSLSLTQSKDVVLQDNNYNSKPEILWAIIVSMVIAFYSTYLILSITIVAINMMYMKLVDFANHFANYAKLEASKIQSSSESSPLRSKDKKENSLDFSKYTLANILDNSPSPSAFIDYMCLILYQQFSSSVVQFYHLLFYDSHNNNIDEELNADKYMAKGESIKLLYEKFCFINHLTEEKLTESNNIEILRTYGFEIVTREDMIVDVFTGMKIKNSDPFIADLSEEDQKLDSLELYMKLNIETSDFAEDQVEVQTFVQIYNAFCDYNRISRVTVSPPLMKDKYNIDIISVPQQFIMRITSDTMNSLETGQRPPFLKRLQTWWKHGSYPKKVYFIDQPKLNSYFNLVMEKFEELSEAQRNKATADLILFPKWWLWDAIAVLFHLIVSSLIVLPLIGLVIMNESQYEQWSLKNPSTLIRFADIIYDPATLIANLFDSFTWNKIFMFMACVLSIFGFLDHMLYYTVMKFPQDKTFRETEGQTKEGFWLGLSRKVEWIFVLFALVIYFGFFSLALTWLLLGAFINPAAFLPFATGAATFITFVVTKYSSFKDIARQGTKAISGYVSKVFGDSVNGVLEKITQRIDKMDKESSTEKVQTLVQSSTFKNVTAKLVETEIVNDNAINKYVQKLEALSTQGIVTGALEVNRDPTLISKEFKHISKEWKQKAIEKAKEVCSSRDIPPNVIDLMIATIIKRDIRKVKNYLKEIIRKDGEKLGINVKHVNLLVDLLLPRGITKEEIVMFVTSKVIKAVLDEKKITQSQEFSELLIQAFNAFEHLEKHKGDAFVKDLRTVLTSLNTQKPLLDELIFYMPAINFVANYDKPFYSKNKIELKKLSLQLLKLAEESASAAENKTFIDSWIKIFSAAFAKYDTFDPDDMLEEIINFWNHLESKKDTKAPNLMPSILYLLITHARGETHELPKKLIAGLHKWYDTKLLENSTFFPFCFNLANIIFSSPTDFEQRLDECLACSTTKSETREFIKAVTTYSIVDEYGYHPSDSWIKNNEFFNKISETMKIDLEEIIGLIDFIYNRKSRKYYEVFLEAILTRMNINKERKDLLKTLLVLFLSENETHLLRALKDLHLDNGEFLLVSKGILDPNFVSKNKYEKLGIENIELIKNQNAISDSTFNLTAWKDAFKKNLEKANSAKEAAAQIKLISTYMVDWNTLVYSQKNVQILLGSLANDKNHIKKLILDSKSADNNEIKLLCEIMSIYKALRLDKGKKDNSTSFDQTKEDSIKKLGEYLSVKAEHLRNFVQMFTIDDQRFVLKSAFALCPELKKDKLEIKKSIALACKQIFMIQKKMNFIKFELPKSIKLPPSKSSKIDKRVAKIPSSLAEKMALPFSKVDFSINDIFKLNLLAIRYANLDLKPSLEVSLDILQECNALALFAKGLLPEVDMKQFLQTEEKEDIPTIFHILTEADIDRRLTLMTGLFKEKDHPLKIFLALYGLLTGMNFDIITSSPSSSASSEKEENKTQEENQKESIKSYLAERMNVYSKIFEVFERGFERDITKFLSIMLPLFRRPDDPIPLDVNLVENLVLLSLGEHANPNYLARKLGSFPDYTEFLLSLVKIKLKPKKALAEFSKSPSMKKVLLKLGIKIEVFTALLKLLFNDFELNDYDAEPLKEIINGLGLQRPNSQDTNQTGAVNINLLSGLIIMSKPHDVDHITTEQGGLLTDKTISFFRALDLANYEEQAYIIFRVSAGRPVSLARAKNLLCPSFHGQNLLDETICALLNPNLAITGEDKSLLNTYISQTKNTLIASHRWIEAFFFRPEAFTAIEAETPNLRVEFILAIVLNFRKMLDTAGDVLGLWEWMKRCINLCERSKNGEFILKEHVSLLLQKYKEINSFFYKRFEFDYESVKEAANSYELLQYAFWKKCFQDADTFHRRINQSFLYLLTMKVSSNKDKVNIKEEMQPNGSDLPATFITKLMKSSKFAEVRGLNLEYLYDSTRMIDADDIGYWIKKGISRAYKCTFNTAKSAQNRIKGHVFTDLSILRAIFWLRSSTKKQMPFQRQLYNLHQLAINLERKLFFDNDHGYHHSFSKFRLMKIAGISLGIPIHNIIEWCLPGSLFTNEYSDEILKAKTDDTLVNLRVNQCMKFVGKTNSEDKEEKAVDKEEKAVGDFGSFFEYSYFMKPLLFDENWEEITKDLGLGNSYLCDPDDIKLFENQQQDPSYFSKAYKSQDGQVYLSREQVSLFYNEDVNLAAQVDSEEKNQLKEKLKDPKTTYFYKELMKQAEDFEKALTDPKMQLYQKIIQNNMLSLIQEDVEIGGENKTKSKIYMALLGLQSYTKQENKDRAALREYLNILSKTTQYDFLKLEEILVFLTSRKPSLPKTAGALEIDEKITNLLFIYLKEKEDKIEEDINNNDEDEEQEKNDEQLLTDIVTNSIAISENDLETFLVIRNLYLLKKGTWLNLVNIFKKDLSLSNRDDRHPLTQLVRYLDFQSIKRHITHHTDIKILNFFNFHDTKDALVGIFEHVILDSTLNTSISSKKMSENKLNVLRILEMMITLNFPSLFEVLVLENNIKGQESKNLTDIQKTKSEGEDLLKTMLTISNIKTNHPFGKNRFRLMRIIVSLAHGNISSFSNKDNYDVAIENIITDMIEADILRSIPKHDVDLRRMLSQLLLGAVGGDVELIIKAFITKNTYKDAHVLYSLYACLNHRKIVSLSDDLFSKADLSYLRILFATVSGDILSNLPIKLMDEVFQGLTGDEDALKSLRSNLENWHRFRGDHKTTLSYITQDERTNSSLMELKIKDSAKFEKEVSVLLDLFYNFCNGTLASALECFLQKSQDGQSTGTKNSKIIINTIISMIVNILNPETKKHTHKFLRLESLERGIFHQMEITFQKCSLNPKDQDKDSQKYYFYNVWSRMSNLFSRIVFMFSHMEEKIGIYLLGDLKALILNEVESSSKLQSGIEKKEKPQFAYDIMSLISNVNIHQITGDHEKDNKTSLIYYDNQRVTIFLENIIAKIFANKKEKTNELSLEDLKLMFQLVRKMKKDLIGSTENSKAARSFIRDVLNILQKLGLHISNPDVIDGLLGLSNGELDGCETLITKMVPGSSIETIRTVLDYLFEIKNIINLSLACNDQPVPTGKDRKKLIGSDRWKLLLKKIEEGTASSRDLFKMVDEEGDKSGSISEKEFSLLAARLGAKLSKHRVKEIFAKVKGDILKSSDNQDLNEKEFEKSLEYLQEKNVSQSLQLLGITPEILAAIFIRLIILLILVFVFIFLGISAFTVGGTVGSIINSVFPAAGGIALSKEKSVDDNVLSEEKVKEATDASFYIVSETL